MPPPAAPAPPATALLPAPPPPLGVEPEVPAAAGELRPAILDGVPEAPAVPLPAAVPALAIGVPLMPAVSVPVPAAAVSGESAGALPPPQPEQVIAIQRNAE